MDTERFHHSVALKSDRGFGPWAATLVALVIVLNGCAAAVVTGVAVGAAAVHDRRTVGTQIDDQGIELRTSNELQSVPELEGSRLRVMSYNGVLLLAGEVNSEAQGRQALEVARSVPGPREVVNELYVTDSPGLRGRSRDTLLTGQVKTAMLGVRLQGFDPTRVKVMSLRGIVYLMGLVTETEADAVVERVRRVRGVRRVVKVFEYRTA